MYNNVKFLETKAIQSSKEKLKLLKALIAKENKANI